MHALGERPASTTGPGGQGLPADRACAGTQERTVTRLLEADTER